MGTDKRVLVVTTDNEIQRLKEPLGLTTPVLSDNGTKPVWIEAPTGGSFSGDAVDVTYDPTASGLTATDVQAAIDEVAAGSAAAHIADATDAHDASAISIVDAGTYFTGTDVEAALQELGAGSSGDVATDTIWDAKGDLAIGTGANTADNLTVGTDGYVLTADSGETTGVKWAPPAASGSTSAWFGDGSDGDFHLDGTNTFTGFMSKSGSTYTLQRDIFAHDLTIDSGVTLNTGTPGSGASKIWANGTVTVNGLIASDGGAAAGSTAGAAWSTAAQAGVSGAGAAGRVNTVNNGVAGGNSSTNLGVGGKGGNGGSDNAGHGGGAGATPADNGSRGGWRSLPYLVQGYARSNLSQEFMAGGGGGGSGGNSSATTTSSGAGGGGGGFIYLFGATVTVSVTGVLRAAGGAGGDASGTGAAGGGGGGGGGLIVILSANYTNSGTVSAPGGAPGNGVNGGANGGAAVDGTVITLSP